MEAVTEAEEQLEALVNAGREKVRFIPLLVTFDLG